MSRNLLVRAITTGGAVMAIALGQAIPSEATNWAAGAVSAARVAQAQSAAAPAATSSLTATCLNTTTETAVVTWTAVAHATSYQVVQATTAAGTYAAAPTQPVGAVTTVSISYVTAVRRYYKLYAVIGSNWKGALSGSATVASTTPGSLVFATSGTRCTAN